MLTELRTQMAARLLIGTLKPAIWYFCRSWSIFRNPQTYWNIRWWDTLTPLENIEVKTAPSTGLLEMCSLQLCELQAFRDRCYRKQHKGDCHHPKAKTG